MSGIEHQGAMPLRSNQTAEGQCLRVVSLLLASMGQALASRGVGAPTITINVMRDNTAIGIPLTMDLDEARGIVELAAGIMDLLGPEQLEHLTARLERDVEQREAQRQGGSGDVH